jgi:hypothetical protein
MDIQALISQLRRYSSYIDQAAGSLELATQVGGKRRRGRPRKVHSLVDRPKSESASGPQPAKSRPTTNLQKG